MVYFGPLGLTAEIGSGVWGTPANFNGFRVFASLLQRCCSPEAPAKLCTVFGRFLGCCTIYAFSGTLAPWRNFARCKIHFTSKSCVLLYWQRYHTALQQPASSKLCHVVYKLYVPSRQKHFYKCSWSEELTALKEAAINSNKTWKAAGKPRQGPIFNKRQVYIAHYWKRIREGQKQDIIN